MKKHTAKQEILGTIGACGPITFHHMAHGILDQVGGIENLREAYEAANNALIPMIESGEIVYQLDSGDDTYYATPDQAPWL